MHRRFARFGRGVALALVLLAGCATAPTAYHAPAPIPAVERPAYNLRVFDRAWEVVNDQFFDVKFLGVDWAARRAVYRPEAERAPDDAGLYLVINRMFGELKESHLAALPPRTAYEFRTQHIAGIGIRMAQAEGRHVITEVLPASPAEAAGVRPGWLVIARDGIPIEKMGPPTADPGQAMTFDFLDGRDQPRRLTLNAALVTFDRREAQVLPGGVLWLRFDSFNFGSLSWMSHQLKEHRNAPGVIVDLRQNPGGLTVMLQLSLGEVFDRPMDGGRFIRRNGHEHDGASLLLFSAHYAGRMAVLVDGASASSSEIFAHVLQHHRRAVIIGRKSAGAVMGARFYSLPGGGRVEVPVEDYVGLDGQRLEGRGVTPDIVIAAPTLADLRAGRDADLAAALAELRKTELVPTR